MIVDIHRFTLEEEPYWHELEAMLDRLETDAAYRPSVDELRRLHYLYQRTASDLARVTAFAAEPELRRRLEALTARAYAEVHAGREHAYRFRPLKWFLETLPQTFRRHIRAFQLSVVVVLVGAFFGGFALAIDEDAKGILMPFPHLQMDPSDRVAMEEEGEHGRGMGQMTAMSAFYMTHNTRVSILAMSLGISYGIGTILVLFANGVMLGAVFFDFIQAGETIFLLGWLLPHGAVEIPAIFIAGQCGLLIAHGLIGWGSPLTMRDRFRELAPDVVTLIAGAAILLIWAGIIEAFFSQFHEPYIPYWVKIAFGVGELALLYLFFTRFGRSENAATAQGRG